MYKIPKFLLIFHYFLASCYDVYLFVTGLLWFFDGSRFNGITFFTICGEHDRLWIVGRFTNKKRLEQFESAQWHRRTIHKGNNFAIHILLFALQESYALEIQNG